MRRGERVGTIVRQLTAVLAFALRVGLSPPTTDCFNSELTQEEPRIPYDKYIVVPSKNLLPYRALRIITSDR
jgi:hypothetical protein